MINHIAATFFIKRIGEFMKKKNSRKNNKDKPCRIVIERKYVGTTKMEDVFKQLAEEEIKNKAEKYIITT